MFRESVRKNAWNCYEKKGSAENRHFQGTANFWYLEAIKCHFEARNKKLDKYWLESYPISRFAHYICLLKGLARNRHFQGTANLGYVEAIVCRFENRKWKFRLIMTRTQSYLIFCSLYFFWHFHGTLLRYSRIWAFFHLGYCLPLRRLELLELELASEPSLPAPPRRTMTWTA